MHAHYCQCGEEIEQGHPCHVCHPSCPHGHVGGVGCRACSETRVALVADDVAPLRMTRHADSVVTDEIDPLPQPPSVFAYLRKRREPRPSVTLTIMPSCACAVDAYGMPTTCLEHSNGGRLFGRAS